MVNKELLNQKQRHLSSTRFWEAIHKKTFDGNLNNRKNNWYLIPTSVSITKAKIIDLILLFVVVFTIPVSVKLINSPVLNFSSAKNEDAANYRVNKNLYVYVETDDKGNILNTNYSKTDVDVAKGSEIQASSLGNVLNLSVLKNNIILRNYSPISAFKYSKFADGTLDKNILPQSDVYVYKFNLLLSDIDISIKLKNKDKELLNVSVLDFKTKLNFLADDIASIQSNTLTALYRNTENRSTDKSFDILIMGIGYESESSEYLRLSEEVKKVIVNGSYTKDNLYRINVLRIDQPYTKSQFGGCTVECSNVVGISNIAKSFGADTVVALVNNTYRYSIAYQPSYNYLGTAFMSRYITLLDSLVLHEMGHSVGRLMDEYVSISSPDNLAYNYSVPKIGNLLGEPTQNCRSTCNFDSKHLVGNVCYKGCGYSSYSIRTTKSSMMKNWRDPFNPISIEAMDNSIQSFAPKEKSVTDTTIPTVSFVNPKEGSTVSGILSIQTSANDDVGVASHKILIDNTGNNIYTLKDCGATTNCNVSLDIDKLDLKTDERPDYFVIVVEAKDKANNLGRKYIEVRAKKTIVDKESPVVNIVSHRWGDLLSGLVNINTTATDNIKVVSHKILIDNTGNPIYTLKDCGGVETCSVSLDINSLSLKQDDRPDYFVIVVEAKDAANNLGRKYIEVKAFK